MILFKTIRYKNFLSSGQHFIEINLDKHRNTIMIGSNGAGKSTILDALTFVLFNKPFRKINKSQLINSINAKECLVELELSISGREYKVVRGIKPNVFEIYCDGNLLNQNAAITDQQAFFEQNILKLNFKSFTQIVVLGSSTFVPFMQLPAAQRREIIEDLLDIKIFSSMNSVLKERVKKLNDDIRNCDGDLKVLEEKIRLQEKFIEELKHQNKINIDGKQRKIEELNSEILQWNSKYNELVSKLDSLQECYDGTAGFEKKFKELERFHHKFQDKIENAENLIKFYTEHDVCPQCNQNINEETKETNITKYKNEILKLNSATEEVAREAKNVSDVLVEKKKILDQINSVNHELTSINSRNVQINKQISEITAEINSVDNSEDRVSTEIANVKKMYEEYRQTLANLNELNNQKAQFGFISGLLKDTGIKSKIVQRYLPVMNNMINQYLQSMDFYVNFSLDENFNETIQSRFRDDFSYTSFSEGEKARIDIALMLTWRAIAKLKNSMNTNLLILDEIFDSSLDTTATDELSYILRTLTDDVNLFIISHREYMVDKFNQVLKFEKYKNFSKMEKVINE